jgi:Big-like domain-containing protein
LASAAQYQLMGSTQWADTKNLTTLAALNEFAKLGANSGRHFSASTYSAAASAIQTQLDAIAPSPALFQKMDIGVRLRYAIDGLTFLAATQQVDPLLSTALSKVEIVKSEKLEIAVDPTRHQPADLALYATRSNALQYIHDQVGEANALADNDSGYAAAVNSILTSITTFDTTSSYAKIQTAFPAAVPTLPSAGADGSYTLNKDDLVNQFHSVVGGVQAMVDQALTNFESGSAGKGGTSGGGGNLDSCNLDACKTAQAAVSGISKLVGFSGDSQLASQILQVGTAGIQAGFAISQIVAAASFGAMLGPAGALVGAGVEIFSALSGLTGGNSNAAFLGAMQKLSEQVLRLQQDMDAQFDHVNTNLNTILTTLNQNFALINFTLGTVQGSVTDVQRSLLDVEATLNGIAWYNLAYQQAQEGDQLMLSVNGCLNYRATHNGQDIGSSAFDGCQNTFFTWAQTNAKNAIWAPLPASFADSAVYGFFEDFANPAVCPGGCQTPFSVAINFLSLFPAQNLGLAPLSPTILPDPDQYILGARMFLLMAHQWPQYQRGLNVTSYINQLITIGTTLQQGLQNANSQVVNGQNTPNTQLFNALTSKYSTHVQNLATALNGDVQSYINNPANAVTKNGYAPQLWTAGANQKYSWRPSIPNIQFCDGTGPSLPAPANLLSAVPDLYAISQNYLGQGQLSMCISGVQWVTTSVVNTPASCPSPSTTIPGPGYRDSNPDSKTYCLAVQTNPGGRTPVYKFVPGDVSTFAAIQVNLAVTFGGTMIATTSVVSTASIVQLDQTYRCTGRYGGGAMWGTAAGYGACGLIIPAPYDNPGWASISTTTDLRAALAQNWTSGLNLLGLLSSTSPTQVPQPPILESIAAQLDSMLSGFQHGIYVQAANDFNAAGTPLQTACQLIAGDKYLLQAYASIGLPESMARNDALVGSLYGDQAIPDCSALQQYFQATSTSSITDDTDNKFNDEVNLLNTRLSQLSGEFGTALTVIQSTGQPESLIDLDETVRALQAFANMQNADALTPCSFQVSPSVVVLGPSGGNGTITVTELNGCAWTASTEKSWVTLGTGSSGLGSGTIPFSVGVDQDPGRDAILIIGDQLVHIMQTGAASGSSGGSSGGSGGNGGTQPVTTQLNLSVDPPSASTGQQETLTATLSPSTSQNSTTNSEPLSFYDGASLLGVGALSNGVASISVTLPTGSHILSASYAGDGTFSASTSSSLPYSVTAAQTNFSLTVGAGSVTIDQPGHSGTQTVQVSSVQGFSGQVNLSCTVAYADSGSASYLPTCAFNPKQVQLSSQNSGSAVLTVSTTAPSTIAAVRDPWFRVGTALAALLFVGTWRRRRQWQFQILQCFVVIMLGATLTGCGKSVSVSPGTTTGPNSPGTTPGKYTITVSAVSGPITESTTINLVVN